MSLFRSNKMNRAQNRVPQPDADPKGDNYTQHGMRGGTTAAWTQAFMKEATAPVQMRLVGRGVSEDDLLADVNTDLLNPYLDEAAWNAAWYLGKAANSSVVAALENKEDGVFAIRDSPTQPGSFAISYRHSNKTHHALIHSSDKGLSLGSSKTVFSCLSDLIYNYSAGFSKSSTSELPCALKTDVAVEVEHDADNVMSEYASLGDTPAQSTLSKVEADGGLVTLDAKTGQAVAAKPSVPSRQSKPRSSFDDDSAGLGLKAGVMLCPHCSSKQSVKNRVCSKCDERLDGTVAPTQRKTTTVKKARASKGGIAPEDVVVSPAPSDLKGILNLPGRDKKPSRGSVAFDEASIAMSRKEARFARGIVSRVDDLAYDNGYYLENGITKTKQAQEKLRGAPLGTFIVYDHPEEADTLMLSYMASEGVKHVPIRHCPEGMYLEGSDQHYFTTLVRLLRAFAGGDDNIDKVLNMSKEDMECELEDADEPMPASPRGSDSLDSNKGHKGPYNKFKAPPHTREPWYQGELSRAEAVAVVEFEPTGSFVVRDNHDEPGRFVLTYVKNGQLLHHEIEPDNTGYTLTDSGKSFDDLVQLVSFYSSEDGASSGHIKCRLRPPRNSAATGGTASSNNESAPAADEAPYQSRSSLHGHSGSSNGGHQQQHGHGHSSEDMSLRPPWLQTNLPKAQALQPLVDQADGAFVVRSSETRKNCYVLSYLFRGEVHHELIMTVAPPSKGFFLNCAPHKAFSSLQELVTYYEQPRSELKFPLQPAAVSSGHTRPRGTSRRARDTSARRTSGGSRRQMQRQPSGHGIAPSGGSTRRASSEGSGPAPPPLSKSGSRRNMQRQGSGMLQRQHSGMLQRQGSGMLQRQGSGHLVGRAGERLDQRAALSNWCCLNLTKEEALARLPQKEGAFVVRRSNDYFATLTMIANGKHFHAQIEDTTQGLHLKKSTVFQPNLSALIAYYKIPAQTDLPRCLVAW